MAFAKERLVKKLEFTAPGEAGAAFYQKTKRPVLQPRKAERFGAPLIKEPAETEEVCG